MGTQILTIIGVVVGALASYAAGSQAERTKYKRMMASRWDEQKRQVYRGYASAVKLTHWHAKKAVTSFSDPARHEALRDEMEKAEEQRSLLYEDLLLLGSPETVAAANDVNVKLWLILNSIRNQTSDPVPWEPLGAELISALTRFHDCARADLGIRGPVALN